MRILIVSQVFYPENFKINDLVKQLTKEGHEVTVITGKPNYPEGKFFKNYGLLSKINGNYFGANVYRLPIFPRGNSSNMRLFLNYISFSIVGSFFLLFYKKKFDFSFVFGVSPIISAFPSIIHKIVYGTKFYLWILDLWPEAITVNNRIKNKFIYKNIEWIVKFIYKKADKIFISSNYMKKSIKKYLILNNSQIFYFPNWIYDSFNNKTINKKKYETLFNRKSFKIMLAGNIGYNIDYLNIIKAANLLKKYDIVFYIVGSGSVDEKFKNKINELNLNNKFVFLGRYPNSEIPNLYFHADVMLITLSDHEIFSFTVPEKLQSYMTMKKPILGMINGETNMIIKKSNSGFVTEAGNFNELSKNAIKMSLLKKSELLKYGKNGYEFSMKNFRLSRNIKKLF